LDVTEMRQAEEHIRYQANLLENVSDAIVATDLDSRITRWNLAAEEIYGWHANEVMGKPLNDFLHTEYPDGTSQAQIFQQFMEQKLWKGEVTQTRKDGKRIVVSASVSLVTDDMTGAPTAMVALNRDITERKQVEENLRILNTKLEQRVSERTAELTHANRAKDEFLANMSHELRTPLNTILGLSEILMEQRRGPLTEAQERALELITSSGQHLLGLINDVLEVSKIEAGKLQIHPDVISVKEVCESSLNFIKELALKKSITLDYWNNEEIARVYADPQRLKQILVNLLNNAVKFTPEKGNVGLEVEVNTEHDQIQFIISDTGIGIAPEDLHKLFTPFTQLDSSLARQYAGTGLGLVLVFKFTELHGGSMQVESEVGKGSRFIVTLPWSETQALSPHTNITSTLAVEPEPDLTSPTHELILLVEDNEANIMLLNDYLQDHGFAVALAHNGFEALDQAEKLSPRLILMDIQMPEMDGLEAIRHLRTNPRFLSTPIIALTALAMRGDRERCLEAGADDYMSKPIRLGELIKAITNLLELKKNPSSN
jgi:PAS domain S-box-containing protein